MKTWIIVLLIILIAAIGIGVYLYYENSKKVQVQSSALKIDITNGTPLVSIPLVRRQASSVPLSKSLVNNTVIANLGRGSVLPGSGRG